MTLDESKENDLVMIVKDLPVYYQEDTAQYLDQLQILYENNRFKLVDTKEQSPES